ncbi:hypothetical protein HMPREF9103_00239 [Lentilactobacillus parafarraginis F0439]|uniref:Uncharacterized protein n=1 Tax=Lentilactobacillus parafarraginis F0439 TaxID=797515 RepID=G9ZKJ2_9LACO|nr:hypothetical protein HMPREF9103_00239 [Lentilactobacillus parafarraginis F0439]
MLTGFNCHQLIIPFTFSDHHPGLPPMPVSGLVGLTLFDCPYHIDRSLIEA